MSEQLDALKHEAMGYIKLKQEYELFKLQWMINHGYTLRALMDYLDKFTSEKIDNCELFDDISLNVSDLFSEWEAEFGFNGNIYPCFEEWFENDRKISSDRTISDTSGYLSPEEQEEYEQVLDEQFKDTGININDLV